MRMPTLYKKTAKGATQQWSIWVETGLPDFVKPPTQIVTEYGQVGGKMQRTAVKVESGKNVGRKNVTSIQQQAESECLAKWKKQKDKGYVENVDVGRPVGRPMLAHDYHKYKQQVIFPAYAQPKLDGIRCLAKQVGDGIVLESRSGKPITTMGHIVKELNVLMYNKMFPHPPLDGELYIHGEKFQNIVSWVKREQPDSLKVEYHVYDVIDEGDFPRRFDNVAVYCMAEGMGLSTIKEVFYRQVDSEAKLKAAHDEWVTEGYEGAILRHNGCPPYHDFPLVLP